MEVRGKGARVMIIDVNDQARRMRTVNLFKHTSVEQEGEGNN